jgi:hypothetical protein
VNERTVAHRSPQGSSRWPFQSGAEVSPTQSRGQDTPPVGKPSPSDLSVWPPFVWSAIGLALVPGFGLGGFLFTAPMLGWPLGRWWLASAQTHSHVFLFGWAGLMVLGNGFHFLPRLRGRALVNVGGSRLVLAPMLSGLILRVLCQPLIALLGVHGPGGSAAAWLDALRPARATGSIARIGAACGDVPRDSSPHDSASAD